MNKAMQDAGEHLDLGDVFCRQSQTLEVFVCRTIKDKRYIRFAVRDTAITSEDSATPFSPEFYATLFSREQVKSIRNKTKKYTTGTYLGRKVRDIEFVRFQISESAETL